MSTHQNDENNALLGALQLLADSLQADAHLSLAATTAWLDPAWMLDDDLEVEEDETSTLAYALSALRQAFPDLYGQANEVLRSSGSYVEVERLVCAQMHQKGIPLDDLTWMAYGIPMPAYGARLNDPDFYEGHEEVALIAQLFDVAVEHGTDVPETAYIAARVIAASLIEQGDGPYQQVSYLLQWLFSCSGNTCVDLDDEGISEMQPLSWEPDEVAFARAVIQEADEMMEQALAGLYWLQRHPRMMLVLRKHIQRVERLLKKKGVPCGEPRIRLHWPRLADGIDGAATAHA